MDNIAIRSPAPTVAEIFAGMKMLEERQNARDEAEHGEANYAGRRRRKPGIRRRRSAISASASATAATLASEIRWESWWNVNLRVLLLREDWSLREQVQHSPYGILQFLQGTRTPSDSL